MVNIGGSNMKKMFVLLFCLALMGCSSSNKDTNGNNSNTAKSNPIKIEELDWKVDEAIEDGKRILAFTYTNNSKFTVVDFKIEFTLKKKMTNEELSKIKTERSFLWEDEDIKEATIVGSNHKIAEPGEMLKDEPCGYNGASHRVEDIYHYNLMEPNIAEIAYLSGDKIYMTYYDFKNKKYTENDNSGTDAFRWSTTDISKTVSKPEILVGRASTDNDSELYFKGFGVSSEYFSEYVKSCKDNGFNKELDEGKSWYRAKNSDGVSLDLRYSKRDEAMIIHLEK